MNRRDRELRQGRDRNSNAVNRPAFADYKAIPEIKERLCRKERIKPESQAAVERRAYYHINGDRVDKRPTVPDLCGKDSPGSCRKCRGLYWNREYPKAAKAAVHFAEEDPEEYAETKEKSMTESEDDIQTMQDLYISESENSKN